MASVIGERKPIMARTSNTAALAAGSQTASRGFSSRRSPISGTFFADRDGAALRAAAARDLVRTTHSTDAMVASVSALYESLLSR